MVIDLKRHQNTRAHFEAIKLLCQVIIVFFTITVVWWFVIVRLKFSPKYEEFAFVFSLNQKSDINEQSKNERFQI